LTGSAGRSLYREGNSLAEEKKKGGGGKKEMGTKTYVD